MLRSVLAVLFLSFPPVTMRQNLALVDDGRAFCSAVLLDTTHVLTAAHCIRDTAAIKVRCDREDYPAQLLKRDADEDLALLQLEEPCGAPVVELAERNPPIGSDVWVLGHPIGHPALSRGTVSNYEFASMVPYDALPHRPKFYLLSDAAIDPGNSGGGMFDSNGRLVGICSMSRGSFGLFVPIVRVLRFLAYAGTHS